MSALKINHLFAVLHLDEARIEYRVLMAAKTFFLEREIICLNITAATREKVAVIIFVKTQNVRYSAKNVFIYFFLKEFYRYLHIFVVIIIYGLQTKGRLINFVFS